MPALPERHPAHSPPGPFIAPFARPSARRVGRFWADPAGVFPQGKPFLGVTCGHFPQVVAWRGRTPKEAGERATSFGVLPKDVGGSAVSFGVLLKDVEEKVVSLSCEVRDVREVRKMRENGEEKGLKGE